MRDSTDLGSDQNWAKYALNRKRLRKARIELNLALNEQNKICGGNNHKSIFSYQISLSQNEVKIQ